ncbi:ABC transporter substrate-binding protein [Gluconobacter thailandicus]|uniref:ABC transporter substrate-binding protein n=2 Tax=Gluconobacter thailandicus TaxID=257438 RepID=A0AAP9EU78_GLUTH|nr:ABC transporter substrate-binding protein [Gluconobacter thailandicus]
MGLALGFSLLQGVAFAHDVQDQRGQIVHLRNVPALRTVFIPMPAPATYISIDGTDKHIVGMNRSSAEAMQNGILGKIFPGTAAINTDIVRGSGFSPNVEAILALHPDVVFQWTNAGSDILESLERAGLPVLGMTYGSQDNMAGYVAMMGAVAGKPVRATELIERQKTALKRLSTDLASVSDANRPRVLYLSGASDHLATVPGTGYMDFMIRTAGGENVAHDLTGSASDISFEQILAWKPDVILIGNFGTMTPDDLFKDPKWRLIPATTSKRVYHMPLGGYRWDPPSQESALTWTWVATLLHPTLIQKNLHEEMREWYRFLYNHELSRDEINEILKTESNSQSADYTRFIAR